MDTVPASGSMDSLSIPENTKIGDVVYYLSANDKEPIYYFIKPFQCQNCMDDMFNVTTTRNGMNGYTGNF